MSFRITHSYAIVIFEKSLIFARTAYRIQGSDIDRFLICKSYTENLCDRKQFMQTYLNIDKANCLSMVVSKFFPNISSFGKRGSFLNEFTTMHRTEYRTPSYFGMKISFIEKRPVEQIMTCNGNMIWYEMSFSAVIGFIRFAIELMWQKHRTKRNTKGKYKMKRDTKSRDS